MIIVALGLYALLTTAQDESWQTYYECFTHEQCIEEYEYQKTYCYAGTCTSRCPPGYSQINSGKYRAFTCECNTDKGFQIDGYFGYPFKNLSIPKCNCTKDFCIVTVKATGIGYTDGLVPHGAPPNCKIDTDEIPSVLSTFGFILVLIAMGLFLLINCRSCSAVIYDLHRYFGLYILGSFMVIVFVNTIWPFSAGFTRSMAFGVVAHNSAEWNLLLRLHFGKTAVVRNNTNICLMVYYLILLLATSMLPLRILLYVAMLQGGFLDWTLVFFWITAGSLLKADGGLDDIFKCCCKTDYSRFMVFYGIGALLHLLTVQVLFAGFILNDLALISGGGFLLVPTFFFYTIWVYGQERFVLFCGPRLFMNYNTHFDDQPNLLLVPFTHTTRAVDVLWNKLSVYNTHGSEPLELENLTENTTKKQDDEIKVVDAGTQGESTNYVVEDCEDFKFGIHDDVKKCACGKCCPCCCGCTDWIPIYWVGAFLCVSVNVVFLYFFPQLFPQSGCNTGFDYGAWT